MIEYINSNSPLHRLDPRSKIIFALCIMAAALLTSSYIMLAFLIIISAIIWVMANIPLQKFKPVFLVLLLFVVMGMLTQAVFYTDRPDYTGTKTILFNILPYNVPVIGSLPVTVEGLKYGMVFSMRMIAVVLAPLIIPFTTHPSDMILVLRDMRFPEWMILMMTMSIRFIPLTFQNFHTIRNAQKLRKIKTSYQDMVLLMETLLITSLKTSKQMALSLETKAFGYSSMRTSFKTIKFGKNDVIFSAFSLTVLGIVVINTV
ncbi:energy-coupling factor transporter transmembrane component T family protein [Methanobacterium ferruginis]|uniref:energy-coupling factor transporter transmembrane component T family protein n=1 Tax=Methanobacterium ferruginis TaxID=710191 RepID=UPI0025727EEF|nr:energy-coupling factor transporter transmembrane component T [Methanobacterium ferruginis]BDZ68087.1 energy-coupling factor transporter transmembrane protein EcfT [Methanobacterium ferruginis]